MDTSQYKNETEILASLRSKLKVEGEVQERRVWINVDHKDLINACNHIKSLGYGHLSSLSATDWPEEKIFELAYHVWSYTDKILITVKTKVGRNQSSIPSVASIWESAQIQEREAHELFGINFDGNDNLNPLFLDEWEGEPPFRKDFDSQEFARERHYQREEELEADYWLKLPPSLKQVREHVPEMEIAQRIGNFQEVELGFNEEILSRQAERCLQCGHPQCVDACPAHLNVKQYVLEAGKGDYRASMNTILERLPFPASIGRICPHPCEEACTLHFQFEPVSIRSIKRFVADQFLDADWYPKVADKKTDQVAIIGAGPAGLTAARNLALRGFQVTVFDTDKNLGGMLMQSIPDYRLPKNIPLKEIDEIKKLGVNFEVATFGKDINIDSLKGKGFGAIFVGIGAHEGFMMGIPGEDKEGVFEALELLKDVKLGKQVPDFKNKKVIVVGGGNVAMDAVRTTLRLGAEVTLVYRRSYEEMPAAIEEIEAAQAEGIKFNILTNPTQVIGNKKVSEVECIRMELGDWDASGRRRPVPVKGSEFKIPTNYLIQAIGEAPESEPIKEMGVSLDRGGRIQVDDNLMTNVEGVFAGGDVVTGPAIAIDAVAAGIKAAEAIENYLEGKKTK